MHLWFFSFHSLTRVDDGSLWADLTDRSEQDTGCSLCIAAACVDETRSAAIKMLEVVLN